MHAGALKAAAVAMLAVAIAAIAVSIGATLEAARIRGPGALVVAPGGVWLAVDDDLWRVGVDGAPRDARDIAAIGSPRWGCGLARAGPRKLPPSARPRSIVRCGCKVAPSSTRSAKRFVSVVHSALPTHHSPFVNS